MTKQLLIVESPAKAKTIKKYLGAGFEVVASKGHIKDLPKKMGIDIEQGFRETFEVIAGKTSVVAEIKAAAKSASTILLATDPDREGEAIAWHLAEELTSGKQEIHRVEFHEITKKGVQAGLARPRPLDRHLYDAQRARRVLDRIVGYDVSALVWSKLAFGLSAGRVQSVALRLIVDRERAIEAFVPVEYWVCRVALLPQGKGEGPSFLARLQSRQGEKCEVRNAEEAAQFRTDLEQASFRVVKVTKAERKRHAPAPYITSRLQQDAVNRLGFNAKRTMQIAQALYEGIPLGKEGSVGLITYMRTDSTRLSPDAIEAVRSLIQTRYGQAFVPPEPNRFRSKKGAQDAHEAIRPTSLDFPPEAVRKYLKDDLFKVYKLIWDRFVACQMSPALYDQTRVEIEARVQGPAGGMYGLSASGRVLKFTGWLEVYGHALSGGEEQEEPSEQEGEAAAPASSGKESEESDGGILPELKEGEGLLLAVPPGVLTEQKYTQPPPRYSEGSLVRDLEDRGIGRPSTYAEILTKVQARDYVNKIEGGRLQPADLGKLVIDGLVQSGLDCIDPDFTSQMEEQLDAVEAGTEDRVSVLTRFYAKFQEQLAAGKRTKRWNPEPETTGEPCTVCGTGEMLKRWSKTGFFLGCSSYPSCKNTRDVGASADNTVQETSFVCDQCSKPMVRRSGRFGEFLACSGYPACKSTRPIPLGVPCPQCGGDIVEVKAKKGGKTFYGCSRYAEAGVQCTFRLWQKPVQEACPSCKAPFLLQGGTRLKPRLLCADKTCGYKKPLPVA